jgi:hypothetical protein
MLRNEEKLGTSDFPKLLGDRVYKDGGREVWIVTRVQKRKPKKGVPVSGYNYYGVLGRSS